MNTFLRIFLTSLAVAGLWYTIRTFIESRRDRDNLVRSGRNGALVDLAFQAIYREGLRLTKHVLIVFGVALTLLPWFEEPAWRQASITTRSVIFVVVSFLLSVTSRQDLVGRRRVIRKQAAEIEKALRAKP
jgi:hypothetical protein